jgi:hypothetical protein
MNTSAATVAAFPAHRTGVDGYSRKLSVSERLLERVQAHPQIYCLYAEAGPSCLVPGAVVTRAAAARRGLSERNSAFYSNSARSK